jgi:hypothetical protein
VIFVVDVVAAVVEIVEIVEDVFVNTDLVGMRWDESWKEIDDAWIIIDVDFGLTRLLDGRVSIYTWAYGWWGAYGLGYGVWVVVVQRIITRSRERIERKEMGLWCIIHIQQSSGEWLVDDARFATGEQGWTGEQKTRDESHCIVGTNTISGSKQ